MSGLPLYNPAFTPRRVGGILLLLDNLGPDEELTPEQIATIRRILHVDDDRTVQERTIEEAKAGERQ